MIHCLKPTLLVELAANINNSSYRNPEERPTERGQRAAFYPDHSFSVQITFSSNSLSIMDTNPICLFDEGASLMIHSGKKTECSSPLVSQQLDKYKVMSSFPEHNLLSFVPPKTNPAPTPSN
ncbi:hypothetical protein CDAR_384861 [Caerostris darwini]|uniref:Uncharacterized protein n=1 Tax=Caerostris darwini TaxID=1538125 RepID=A0AAV4WCG4_9ARAC|nr:hypothetical protein CDAR_384861 [Caerostris darwini]